MRESRKMWHENRRAQSPEGQDCRCQGRRQPRATPEYLAQFVKSEIERWATTIKASGVTVD
jgi:tripartite-type tricarboxylate transporter receptor subunit TctC